ncbi:MAG: excinuclease ABC subunit UvrA [Pirellulaceae bacterium]
MNDISGAPKIEVRGVRVHNLKDVDVDIPRGCLVAVCGVSGSGKTSLALDTLYAEGQRRYIESFSAYTRQFLERLDKPDYDRIDGLPPALAVARGSAPRGNRSTVGTASETLDYLRLLFSKIAELFCHSCGNRVISHTPQNVAKRIAALPADCKLMVAFEVHWDDVADRAAVLAEIQSQGFVRLISAGVQLNLGQADREQLIAKLPKQGRVLVVVDRLRGGDTSNRTTESLETAFAAGQGEITLLLDAVAVETASTEHATFDQSSPLLDVDGTNWRVAKLSRQLHCATCNIDFPTAEPRLFSFNSPLGACSQCEGFGDTIDLDMDLVVPDQRKSIAEGAIAPWSTPAYSQYLDELLDVAEALPIPVDIPFQQLNKSQIKLLRDGRPSAGYGGLKGFFAWLERKKYKMHVRVFLSRWRSYNRCSKCDGARLNDVALSYCVGGRNIAEMCELQITELKSLLESLTLTDREREIASVPLQQTLARLGYLITVGLGYLNLNRPLRTLSGGEAQRTALTAALGSSLVNMLYVLDEPSVGLHPHDVEQLAKAISNLTQRGNTVVIIEHEEALLDRAHWIIEVGPAAGSSGGEIVYSGPRENLSQSDSLTGNYLSRKRCVPIPIQRRKPTGTIQLTGCTGHNLKSIDVEFPLGVLCLVTGVSGSGKSSLVQDTLCGALGNRLTSSKSPALPFENVLGTSRLDDFVLVDQSPVSRSPRSNPVTYVKAFDEIRNVFADTLESRTHNYTAGHFSFNSDLGRCPKCNGDGVLQIDMQFLADIHMTCTDCGGKRYRSEILRVRYRDRNIAEVLSLTVREAQSFFRGSNKVQQKLKVLSDVGLDYLQLGQAATTLSAGEAQRLKLAAHLASATKKKTLFVLDEPTTGLHTNDIVQLLDCFDALLAVGHSLVIVEHNLHLMAAADYIIDLGPGPAEAGGRIVATGTPEQIAACPDSITGQYLAQHLNVSQIAAPS